MEELKSLFSAVGYIVLWIIVACLICSGVAWVAAAVFSANPNTVFVVTFIVLLLSSKKQ